MICCSVHANFLYNKSSMICCYVHANFFLLSSNTLFVNMHKFRMSNIIFKPVPLTYRGALKSSKGFFLH